MILRGFNITQNLSNLKSCIMKPNQGSCGAKFWSWIFYMHLDIAFDPMPLKSYSLKYIVTSEYTLNDTHK